MILHKEESYYMKNKKEFIVTIILFLIAASLYGIGFRLGVGSERSRVEKLKTQQDPIDVKVYLVFPDEEELIEESKEYLEFEITAYDNTVESQGPWIDQTATGFNLKGHTLETAKCIAVDPKVIPLNSKVEIIFDEPYEHFSDTYIARDTGGLIKGNRIDLFMGDGVSRQIVRNFGRRKARVRVLD